MILLLTLLYSIIAGLFSIISMKDLKAEPLWFRLSASVWIGLLWPVYAWVLFSGKVY